jgi:hypothetical protein
MFKNEDQLQQSENTTTPIVESSANQLYNIKKNDGLIQLSRLLINIRMTPQLKCNLILFLPLLMKLKSLQQENSVWIIKTNYRIFYAHSKASY